MYEMKGKRILWGNGLDDISGRDLASSSKYNPNDVGDKETPLLINNPKPKIAKLIDSL